MKLFILYFILVFFFAPVFGQKAILDTSIINRWPFVEDIMISNNGMYVYFKIQNRSKESPTYVFESTNGKWKTELLGVSNATFASEASKAIFMKKDTLGILTLGTSSTTYVSHIKSFKILSKKNNEWLAYLLDDTDKTLILLNLITSEKKSFTGVVEYLFSNQGEGLLLKRISKIDSLSIQTLYWIKFSDQSLTAIWNTSNSNIKINNYVFDKYTPQLAFLTTETIDSQEIRSIWYYNVAEKKAVLLINEKCPNWDSSFRLGVIKNFSENGKMLFLELKEKYNLKVKSNTSNVDIWSYTDAKLQSLQLKELELRSYTAVVGILNHQIIRLQRENDVPTQWPPFTDWKKDEKLLVLESKNNADLSEWNWNLECNASVCIISTENGFRKKILNDVSYASYGNSFQLSPQNKFVVYFDAKKKAYFTYEVSTGVIRDITKGIKVNWTDLENDRPASYLAIRGVAAWLPNDSMVLVYDSHDIWQLDPMGNKSPSNLTNGYGFKNDVVFNLLKFNNNINYIKNNKCILTAFNKQNKDNGFFEVNLGQYKRLKLLTMGPYIYTIPGNNFVPHNAAFSPIRANDVDAYVVMRMSSTESPNYFYTVDFKNFIPLSDVYPEKSYNWLKAKKYSWKSIDGKALQGILYMPENFNPQNKYPLIIHLYEIKSDGLNGYLQPRFSQDDINIPWFVSRGYLVFTPDIRYTIGQPGKSAYNCVIPIVKYLIKVPFIDASKIGIQGHSWGGFETNYLITHSNIFAAAISSSGISDFISGYGSLLQIRGGGATQLFYELQQCRIGATLWEKPKLYINNSPVLYANRVTTPLLMINNKGDDIVPFQQGVEFYLGLRRLRKKVWMLQYDKGVHGVIGKDAIDYTLRMTQFFDHYLKGNLAPKWLTEGVRAVDKGVETGYDLDPAGNCGLKENKCKICSKWNDQYRKTPEMFSQPSGDWHLDEDTIRKQRPVPKAIKSSESMF
jgi:hypothetical protein